MKIRNKALAAIGIVAFAVAVAFNVNAGLDKGHSEFLWTA